MEYLVQFAVLLFQFADADWLFVDLLFQFAGLLFALACLFFMFGARKVSGSFVVGGVAVVAVAIVSEACLR